MLVLQRTRLRNCLRCRMNTRGLVMKKLLVLMMCVSLAFGMTACGKDTDRTSGKEENTHNIDISATAPGQDAATAEVAPAATEETPMAEEVPVLAEWKIAYVNKLGEYRNFNPEVDEFSETPDSYYLYDIDKNGIPELIIKFGSCEADYHGTIYTYDEGQGVKTLDTFGMGHMSLYSYPDGNGILLYQGHMGYACMEVASIENNILSMNTIFEETLDYEQSADDYTPPETVVPGVEYLPYSSMSRDLFVLQYEMVLAATESDNSPVPELGDNGIAQRVDDYMNGNGSVGFYATESYYTDPGMMSYQELLLMAEGYEHQLHLNQREYVDMNRDGYKECVISLIGDDAYSSPTWIVFNLQNDQLYGYILRYMDSSELLVNGVMRNTFDITWSKVLIFDKDECMMVNVSNGTNYAVVM